MLILTKACIGIDLKYAVVIGKVKSPSLSIEAEKPIIVSIRFYKKEPSQKTCYDLRLSYEHLLSSFTNYLFYYKRASCEDIDDLKLQLLRENNVYIN